MLATRPPSNTRSYDDFYSGDSAFLQLADDASEDARKAHQEKWVRARETGNFSELRVDGAEPTKFAMRPLKAEWYAALQDMAFSGERYGVPVLAFRLALQSVANFPEEVSWVNHQKFGRIATLDFLDRAGVPAATAVAIAQELGSEALERARQLSPRP